MVWSIISSIVLITVCIIFIIDVVSKLKDWFSRIHIGRYENTSTWEKKMIEQGSKWLLRTPKIPVTDNTRLIVIDMLKGNYTKAAIQHWQEAALLLGLGEYVKTHQDAKHKYIIESYLNKTFTTDGNWVKEPVYVDGAILAYAVMKLDFLDTNKYKKAFDATWEMIQKHIGEDNTVAYRTFMKDYRYVDTIGFICPFLIRYGLAYNKPECVALAVKQIREYNSFGMHPNLHIPSHAYHIKNEAPLGLYGWGRGLGWYAIGLADAWKELPHDHMDKAELKTYVRGFAKAALRWQQTHGGWNWTVTRSESVTDSSATATLAWFLLAASELKDISVECLQGYNKAIHYLMSVTRKSGAVDFSQGDTKDIGVYSTLFSILPFAQGFCIRAVSAMENNKN
ncbi:glycoside hydrolase family 88 protein [Ectobacillus sp. JY-23]|uniref:glycoside hydrolase family 88 protein n=1 Tax=Ectobacillus sp. JY-23 TaxID=2933872 RepID=UPI001FF5711A|nr:glycoside hydrolase family 88 protein [Ectobacillus sp. JY-23]UOY92704.1 glycoside hydrolase family 88 protein [Ectobacillus sp. JY-23]